MGNIALGAARQSRRTDVGSARDGGVVRRLVLLAELSTE